MGIDSPQISALKRISAILKGNGFRFCLTGGLAVGIHASPRATEDVDIIIELDEEKKTELLSKITKEFKLIQNKNVSFSFADIWRLVLKDDDVGELIVIDLIIANSERLKNAISNAFILKVDDADIPVISKGDLIDMKQNSTRLKDQLDIESLKAENEDHIC
jgi:hypothetical protein